MIILDPKGLPSPAVVVLLIAAIAYLEERGGWWFIAGIGILGLWVVVSAVHQAYAALHIHIGSIGDELEDVFKDMESDDDPRDP